jgi:hypothetical protein
MNAHTHTRAKIIKKPSGNKMTQPLHTHKTTTWPPGPHKHIHNFTHTASLSLSDTHTDPEKPSGNRKMHPCTHIYKQQQTTPAPMQPATSPKGSPAAVPVHLQYISTHSHTHENQTRVLILFDYTNMQSIMKGTDRAFSIGNQKRSTFYNQLLPETKNVKETIDTSAHIGI